MDWKELLSTGFEYENLVAQKLTKRLTDADLSWKPTTGQNWMSVDQLLFHLATCGAHVFKGFITGEWPVPEGMTQEEADNMTVEEMLPPAEQLPRVQSVQQALDMLQTDLKDGLAQLAACPDDAWDRPCPAPWDPTPIPLGQQLLSMVNHVGTHKAQLYYYLKLMGQPVNTGDLWGDPNA